MSRQTMQRIAVTLGMAALGVLLLFASLVQARGQAEPPVPNKSLVLGSKATSPSQPPTPDAEGELSGRMPAAPQAGGAVYCVTPGGGSFPGDCDQVFTTVQAAVDAIAAGGTVKVATGTYTDTNGDGWVVVINKSLTLQGGYTTSNWRTPDPDGHPTYLDGQNSAQVVRITGNVAPVVAAFHIRNGAATSGAGVYIGGGQPTLARNRIYDNVASTSGGGVYVAAGEALLENNLVYGNTALTGGGLYVATGSAVVRFSTFYGNNASLDGGGIYVFSGSPSIYASIVVSNTAAAGGGVFASAGNAVVDYNNVWDNIGGNYGGMVAAGEHSTSTAPLLVNPGGGDFHLQAGSVCIDYLPITITTALDYDGWARPLGPQADLGAHEFYTGTCFVRVAAGRVYTSVQEAVDASSPGDLLRIAGYCAGVESRAGMLQVAYVDRRLTLQGGYTITNWTIPDPVALPTFLDAEDNGRVIYIANVDATVRGLHIVNGRANGNGGGIYVGTGSTVIEDNWIYENTTQGNFDGGGIYVLGGSSGIQRNEIYSNSTWGRGAGIAVNGGTSVLIQENVIRNNTANVDNNVTDGGGGIFIGGGTVTVRNNNIYQNAVVQSGATYSHRGGGGIAVEDGSGVVIENNQIYENTISVAEGQSAGGGGIYIGANQAIVAQNEVYSNTTNGYGGGGIYVHDGNSQIQRNRIYNNVAQNGNNGGGGIYVYVGTPLIEANTIYGNNAPGTGPWRGGGGLYVENGTPIIRNNLFYANVTDSRGGAIKLYDGSSTVENNTIYGNSAGPDGGGGIYRASGTPTLRNNIIANNTDYGVYGSVTVSYSDFWLNSAGACGGGATCAPAAGNIFQNPLLVDPAGGDYHLQSASPCRDTADPSNYPSTDYDGFARPFGPGADMGAYEFYSGTCFARINGVGQVYDDVQAAIDAAAAGSDVRVAGLCQGVHARLDGSTTVTQTAFISKQLTLRGGYTLTNWLAPSAITTLDAGGNGRVVYVTGSGPVVVERLVLRHGSAITGGGLYLAAPSLDLTVQNVVLYGNSATYGGGFAASGGSPLLYHNTFYNNSATANGGGLYLPSGSPVVRNTIVATHTHGGIWVGSGATPDLDYNLFWGNQGGNIVGGSGGAHDVLADPLFVNPAAGDLHLTATSPAIHAGDPTPGVALDWEGDPRPLGRGYDIGADESALYPDIAFEPDQIRSVAPDTEVVYTHYLTNSGTVTDTFDIAHWTDQPAWDVTYEPVVALQAGEGTAFQVTIRVPAGTLSGTVNTLILTATSRLNTAIHEAVTDTTIVNWFPGVSITPSYADRLNPGTVVTYVHTLVNTGNAEDSFQLSLDSTYGWTVITPTEVLNLPPAGQATIWAVMSIPHSAPGGITETAAITATGSSGVWDVATDSITVNHTTGDRYVRVSGSDTLNSCLDPFVPCASVAHAVAQAATNDTIKVAGGTYNEVDIYINKNVTLRGGYSPTSFAEGNWNPATYPTILDADGQGRVMRIFGNPTVEWVTVKEGYHNGSGGGLYIEMGSPTIRHTRFVNNTATQYGGGIYNSLDNMPGRPVVEQNIFSGNSAQYGGAFASATGNVSFWNNMLYGNQASQDGGAVYIGAGTVRVWHNTFHANTATRWGGALYAAAGNTVISNTIVVNNSASAGGGIYRGGGTMTADYNDVWNNSGGDYSGVSGGPHSLSVDPLLVDPANGNLHLQSTSPCIDQGNATSLSQDLDGGARTVGPAPDIGADEFQIVDLLFAPDRTGSGLPEQTVQYTHFLTNTGTYTDTFYFACHSSQGWEVTCPTNVTVGAGQVRQVNVGMRIPACTPVGTVDVTDITAYSLADPTVHATVWDTTTVGLKQGVSLEPDLSVHVNSYPGSVRQVVFPHVLTNLSNRAETIQLGVTNVEQVTGQQWNVTISPLSVVVEPCSSKPVTVTVNVPPLAPTCDNLRVDLATATAHLVSNPSVADSASDTTVVNQCAGLIFEPDRNGVAMPGQTIVYTHTLTNTGNYDDRFYFHITGNWISVQPAQVTLASGNSAEVAVRVTIPTSPPPPCYTEHQALITAYSTFDPAVSDAVMDTTTIAPLPGVAIGPDLAARVASAADHTVLVTFTHMLINTGNCTFSFNLDAESSQGFVTTVTPQHIANLPTLASTPVTVTVAISPSAPLCTNAFTDVTTVNAEVAYYSGYSDEALDTTRVNECGLELAPSYIDPPPYPSGRSAPGTAVNYAHILTNTGVLTDSYVLTYLTGTWQAEVAPLLVVELPPGGTAPVTATVHVPPGVISGTRETLVVTATSQSLSTLFDAVVDETVVPYAPQAVIAPDNWGQAAPHGVITYSHTLTNTGNYTDSFTLATNSSFGFSVIEPSQTPSLGPGESYGPIVVTVTLPSYAETGKIELTQAIATFNLAPQQQAVALNSTLVLGTAGTRYVAPDGIDDGNNCTDLDFGPCATVNHAVEQAASGDEVRVAQGVFTDVHTVGGLTQAVWLDKDLVLRGGYSTANWNNPNPLLYPTILDAGGLGRVIYIAASSPTISGFHLRNGYVESDHGAGIYVAAGAAPTIQQNRLYDNVAQNGFGGAIYAASGASLLLERNAFYRNAAFDGAAVYLTSGGGTVSNNVLYDNHAASRGGGLYNGGGSPTLWNNTFFSNTASYGGGVYNLSGAPAIRNTILAGNVVTATGGGIYDHATGGTPAMDYNDVWGNTPDDYSGVSAGAHDISSDPLFINAAAYNLHITSASPCFDAGDPATPLNNDHDGNHRPLFDSYDIGAYEYGLSTDKLVSALVAPPGGEIGYLLTISNTGGTTWYDITLTDTLHSLLEYVPDSLQFDVPAGYYDAGSRTIVWNGDLQDNQAAHISFSTRITDWVAAGTAITNVGWVNNSPTWIVTTTVLAKAGPRYVAPTGSNALNNCLVPTKPCATIQYAVDQALDGDQVRVAAGTYAAPVTITRSIDLLGGFSADWSAQDPVAYPTIIDGHGLLISGTVEVTVAGFDIRNGTTGISVQDATLHAVQNRIHGHSGDGIHVSGGDLTLERAWVYENGGDGVNVATGSYTLTNVVLAHNSGPGLRAAGSTGQVLHATFARNGGTGAVIGGNALFTNTLVYSHTLGVDATTGAAAMWNTLWWENTVNTSGTVTSTNQVSGDPRFIDPAAVDYHIHIGSAAMDAGTESGVSEDVDGDPRPLFTAPDIGADEYPLLFARAAAPLQALPCQPITHTMSLFNMGRTTISGLSIGEVLPAQVSYVEGSFAASSGSGGVTNGVLNWSGDVVDAVWITFTVQITPYLTNGTVITHVATVEDPVSSFATPPLTVTVRTLEGTAAKSGPAQATIGQVVTYTIAYTVPAGHAAYNTTLVDTLPRVMGGTGPALAYRSGSGSPAPALVSPDGGTITWTLPTVAAPCGAPQVRLVTFAAQVQDLPENNAGDLLTNTVELAYTEAESGGPAHALSAAQTALLVEPGLEVEKEIVPAGGVGALDLLAVVITATNTGGSPLYGLIVTDTLPAELDLVSAPPECSEVGAAVVCSVAQIGPGEHVVLTLTVEVAADVGANQLLTNNVVAWGASQPASVGLWRAYMDAAQATARSGYPDLAVAKSCGTALLIPGGPITYTIAYTNVGVVRALSVSLVDTLPAEVSDVTWSSSRPASVSQAGRQLTWNLSDPLGPAEGGRIWITATISSAVGQGDVLTNTVVISTTTAEANSSNNQDTVARAIGCVAISDLAFVYSPAAPRIGQTVTFTGTVSPDSTTPISYTWSFGDGSAPVEQSGGTTTVVTHTFTSDGTYSVTLAASNACSAATPYQQMVFVDRYHIYLPLVLRKR